MYTSSSLSPLSLLLSEVTVSDSSLSLPGKYSSSDSIPSCSVYFATSADNQCERDDCGGSAGDGSGSSLHTRFCVIGAFRFTGIDKLIGKLFPTEPQRHKFTVHISGPH